MILIDGSCCIAGGDGLLSDDSCIAGGAVPRIYDG